MAVFLDARIPVVFGREGDRAADDALLAEGTGAAAAGLEWFTPGDAPHVAGCACCAGGRNGAAQALSRLMLARARRGGFVFRRVLVTEETEAGRAAVLAALAEDPLASAWFRAG